MHTKESSALELIFLDGANEDASPSDENSGLLFSNDGTPTPIIDSSMSDSTVQSLNEMRNSDREAHEIAERQLAINGHNDMLKDLISGKRIKNVRLEDDGKTIIIEAQANNYVRKTSWSLKMAKEIIPGKWYEDIPEKVAGILEDLDVGTPKSAGYARTISERAAQEREARANLSGHEREVALQQYNSMLATRYGTKTIVSFRVENNGKTIVLTTKFCDKTQKIAWTIDHNGRFF